jgi:hypothetical protein
MQFVSCDEANNNQKPNAVEISTAFTSGRISLSERIETIRKLNDDKARADLSPQRAADGVSGTTSELIEGEGGHADRP